MKTRIVAILCVLALTACESKSPEASAEQPAEETSKAKSDEKAKESEGEDESEKDKGATAKEGENLRDKSCEEFYTYSRDVCMKSLQEGLGVNCYQVVVQADSTRKLMTGEDEMPKSAADLSDEEKARLFCGRFYEKLAKRVAKADTKKVEHPPKCKKAIQAIDTHCLKPMAAGKAYGDGCQGALQSVSKWSMGEQFCQISTDMVTK